MEKVRLGLFALSHQSEFIPEVAMAFVWKSEYSVGIREIDEQHKKLVKLIHDLDAAMQKGQGKQSLGTLLKELIGYTGNHFAAEERLMKTYAYPEYEAHKEKHEKMTQKVLDIQRQHAEGRVTITLEVMQFLENWLDKHILGTDQKYSSFLRSHGVQ